MSKIESIPTSKLVFETVFPGHIEIVSRVGIEEEIFLRLTREYSLPSEVVHRLIREDQEKIRARGDNIKNYFFNGDKKLDESLNALYSGVDHVGKLVSTVTSLRDYTFSEYTFFQGMTSTLWNNYRKRQTLFDLCIEDSADISKMHSSSIDDKDAEVEEAERQKAELVSRRDREKELIEVYNVIANLCLTKSLDCLDTCISDLGTLLRMKREVLRVYSSKTAVTKELFGYLDIDNDYYQHDTDLLNQHGIDGYSFSKKK